MSVKVLLEKAKETIEAYDEAYADGMDHEQGFDFARDMRGLILNLVKCLEKLEASDD